MLPKKFRPLLLLYIPICGISFLYDNTRIYKYDIWYHAIEVFYVVYSPKQLPTNNPYHFSPQDESIKQ